MFIQDPTTLFIQDKNPEDKFGMTPFHMAAENGHLEVCKLILVNVQDKYPKNSWYAKGFFKMMLKKNSKSLQGCSPLELAIENGHLDVVELISSYRSLNIKVLDLLLEAKSITSIHSLQCQFNIVTQNKI